MPTYKGIDRRGADSVASYLVRAILSRNASNNLRLRSFGHVVDCLVRVTNEAGGAD